MPTNWKQLKAIEQKNKERILECNPYIPEMSGIYIFTRVENGFKYAYVGQAVNLLERCAKHLSGYQHIDLSLKKRGLYDIAKNPTGWDIEVILCEEWGLDSTEQHYIQQCAQQGYQLYNHTTGGQGDGKRALGETKSPKSYRDGVAQGRKNVIKEIAHLFDLHLKAVYKADKPSKNAEKAMQKFMEMIQGENRND